MSTDSTALPPFPNVTSRQWELRELTTAGLVLTDPIPVKREDLGPTDVLVKIKSVSLNYRDVMLINDGGAGILGRPNVPLSDASGLVVAVGSKVRDFRVGDRVVNIFFQDWQEGYPSRSQLQSTVGAEREGVLREFAILPASGLVHPPKNLNWDEAATLSCAALSGWSALHGLRDVKKGDYVLTQGTGGVSLFALQFAKAAGAHVVATTSSDEKAQFLRDLGADHVINYKTNPEWGSDARALTPNNIGFDIIVEVGGPTSLPQSIKAIRIHGIVSLVGFLSGFNYTTTALDIQMSGAILSPIIVGNKADMEVMIAAIEEHQIKPVIDKRVFAFEEAKEAIGIAHFSETNWYVMKLYFSFKTVN